MIIQPTTHLTPDGDERVSIPLPRKRETAAQQPPTGQQPNGTTGRFMNALNDAGVTEATVNAVNALNTDGGAGGVVNATDGTVPALDSYDKMLEYMKASQMIDADASKRQRRREMLASIGDAISALSSMYQTTKGAPVTYQHGQNMDAEVVKRGERMAKDRASMNDKYMNYLKMQQAKEQADEFREYKRANQEIRRAQLDRLKAKDEADAKRKDALADATLRYKEAAAQNQLEESNKYYYKIEGLNKGLDEEAAEVYANQKLVEWNNAQEAAKQAKQEKDLQVKDSQIEKNNRANQGKQQKQSKSSGNGGGKKKVW